MVWGLRPLGVVRRGVLALIDDTMSDLRDDEADPNALTVFAEDLTEVNLDLSGALEAVMEKVTVNHRMRAPSLPAGAEGWSGDIDELIEEEFSISERTDEDDLPELPYGDYLLVPPVNDLVIGPSVADLIPPARGRSARVVSLKPKPAQLAKLPLLVGKPTIETHRSSPSIAKPPESPRRSLVLPWVASAIALWAATILCAWALKVQLYELIGL